MKYFIVLGAFAGFSLTFATGTLAGNPIDNVLVDSAVGCLVGGFLLRGFRHLYIHSLRTVVTARASRAATEQTEEPSTQTP